MITLRHDASGLTVWTLGHSSRSFDELLAALRAFDVRLLADVRRYPVSRRHPQFNRDALSASLGKAGMTYRAMQALGGFREGADPGRRQVLANPAFRGYADYMATAAFGAAVDRLLVSARRVPGALMCAERDWRACHRSLLADYLVASGARVLHIDDAQHCREHVLTGGVRIEAGRLDYGGPQRDLL